MLCAKFYMLLFAVGHVQTNVATRPYNTVVSFGDANTDTGNVYRLTNHQWPLVPPYYEGRFSNGLLWIERLGIPTIQNYAYGDATIDNDNLLAGYTGPNATAVPGIRQQIVTYLAAHEISTVDLSRTLYVIWASGQEYLLNSSLPASAGVAYFLTTVYDLLVLGIDHLIILNVPPLQLYPGLFNDRDLETSIVEHNTLLASNLTQIQLNYPQIAIQLFDVHALVMSILANGSMYKLDKEDPCWNTSSDGVISQCTNPDQYVFIDGYHFTSSVHQIIADQIKQFLVSTAVKPSLSSQLLLVVCICLFAIKKF